MKPADDVPDCLAIADSILTAQLITSFPKASEAFSSIITNKLAMGYVFGTFDSLVQKFQLFSPDNPTIGLRVIEVAYLKVFGEFGGNALFGMAKAMQGDPEFFKGRCIGGNEVVAFLEHKEPPLGLGRIVLLGMNE